MNKKRIMMLVAAGAIALGAGGIYTAGNALAAAQSEAALRAYSIEGQQQLEQTPEPTPEAGEEDDIPRLRPWREKFTPPGLLKRGLKRPDRPMPGWEAPWFESPRLMEPRDRNDDGRLERLRPEEALEEAESFAAGVGERTGEKLRVDKLLQFSNGFLAIITEDDTGRGAFRLLVNPFNGKVKRASGVDVAWNTKYLRRGVAGEEPAANMLTMTEAAARAAEELSAKSLPGVVSVQGYEFYGYFAFEYQVDGVTVGMVAVNGESGRVWLEHRTGEFLGIKIVTD